MRILHIGNIANNAYNNAKFLRRKGIDAFAVCYDYSHVMSQPEWEDAEFDGEVDEYYPDWSRVDLNGFRREDWFHQLEIKALHRDLFEGRTKLFPGQFFLEWKVRQCRTVLERLAQFLRWRMAYALRVRHRRDPMRYADVVDACSVVRYLRPFLQGYDIIQAYGLYEPKYALLGAPGCPLVAFEHGTMRDFPFEETAHGRWISLAYKKARKVIITNPDSIHAARRMGLTNIEFIPHPVDETVCRPRDTPLAADLRNRFACEHVIFCPSRQNWALKGNDKVVRAFATLVKSQGVDAVLLLCRWGQEVQQTVKLIDALGVQERVHWLPPLNKRKLVHYYNAADIVLDQFMLGVFGTTTPEAMACAKPVMLYFDPDVHQWCFPEMPPVLSARSEQEIAAGVLEVLRNPDSGRRLGRQARAWVEKHHGWELVADRQICLYRDILNH